MRVIFQFLGFVCIICSIVNGEATDEPPASEQDNTLEVLNIVEAISQVQNDVTKNPSNKNNIKVASGVLKEKTPDSTDPEVPDLLDRLHAIVEPETTTQSKPYETNYLEDPAINEIEDDYTPIALQPPTDSLLSYDGVFAWFNWVVAMRDPRVNPKGTSSWPDIVATGIVSIFQQYNPFRGFLGRALGSESLSSMLAVYNNRQQVISALAANQIQPDAQSILDYALKLETETNHVDDDKGTDAEEKVTEVEEKGNVPLPTGVTALLNILNGQPFQVGVPNLKPVPANTPVDVLAFNKVLKWIYILIPLLFLPFSGIENFFLAPLPPNLDTVPGTLRLFGLQALLGPDYVLDYDAAYDPAYDTPGDEAGEPPAEPADFEDYDYGAVRRKDVKLRKKVVSSYSEMSEGMKPPPSRYGVSSYTSYQNKAATER